MLSVIKRACLHPIDYSGVFKRTEIVFKEQRDEGNDTYSFIFEKAPGQNWLAGQHGIFTMPSKKIDGKTWRAFSVASSAAENEIRIGTIVVPEPSSFKAYLRSLTPGETITINGPFGEFHCKNKAQHIVGVAGGIGITPFRAIAYEIAHNINVHTKLSLIYAGKNGYFAYRAELEAFAEHPNLDIRFVNTPEEVTAVIEDQFALHSNQADYYISGSPGMIKGVKKTMIQLGVKKIVNDPFKGY